MDSLIRNSPRAPLHVISFQHEPSPFRSLLICKDEKTAYQSHTLSVEHHVSLHAEEERREWHHHLDITSASHCYIVFPFLSPLL